jgi:hypothetical protein
MFVRVLCGGIAMAKGIWFFAKPCEKPNSFGRGPSGDKEIPYEPVEVCAKKKSVGLSQADALTNHIINNTKTNNQ